LNIDDVELRATTSDEGVTMITGYAARFNSWSEDLGGFRERIMPGAFKKALMVSDVRALYNHDSNNLPLGRTPKTLRLSEDTKGLKFEADLPDTQFARDLAISIQRKDITGNSFSFTVADGGDEMKTKDDVYSRTITEFKELFDIGPVVFPAYASPKVKVAQRALDKAKELKSVVIDREQHKGVIVRDEQKNLEIDILTIENSEV
jgi:HK97 family phage prohead protease